MNALRRYKSILFRRFRDNLDLVTVWVALISIQPMIPEDHVLAQDDLGPWLTLSVSIVALLRARHLGAGPHPMLTKRRSAFGWFLRRVAVVLAPWALLFWYEGANTLTPTFLGLGILILLAAVVLLGMGRNFHRTGWNPPGLRAWVVWGLMGVFLAFSLAFAGALCGDFSSPWTDGSLIPEWFGIAALSGTGYLVVGMMSGRARNHRQRKAAGRRDGRPHRADVFPALLAFAGPAVGYALLNRILGGTLDFSQAYAGALHVVVWAAVLWPRPDPVARACVLHEVIPAGGGDKEARAAAASFERPPEGALRFNPLRSKRILVVHPWMVPVHSSRIDKLDDPVRDLWRKRPPFLPHHILGEAAFEPDPVTRMTQWDVIHVKMSNRQDMGAVSADDAQSRRIVVLRPFPPPGKRSRRRVATYRWDEGGTMDSLQVVDATTESATLMDGDVLVLSSEGVARAFEVELGAPLYEMADVEAFRPPQLEDYVKVG